MSAKTRNGRTGDLEIKALVGIMVGAGVWTAAQGNAKRRQFAQERRQHVAYIRGGAHRRRR